MADVKRKYIIQQKLETGTLTLWPETLGSQIINETDYRVLGKNSFILGGTYSAPDLNPSELSTGIDNYSTTVQAGTLTDNITLTLPIRTGTIALKTDIPSISFTDGIFDGTFTITTDPETGDQTGAISFIPYAAAADGKFSSTSSTANGNTDLSYSGHLYVNDLNVAVNAEVTGTLTTTGVSYLNNGINVNSSNFTVSAAGAVYAKSTLEVDGTTTLDGIVDINNSATIDGATISLDATANSNFTVTGATGTASNLTLSAANSSTGTADVLVSAKSEIDLTASTIDINGSTTTTIDGANISLDATTSSNFTITGNSVTEELLTLKSTNVNASGSARVLVEADDEVELTATSIDINGAADISGSLGVGGNTTLTGDLAVNGGDLTTTASSFNLLNKDLTDGQSYTINLGQGSDTGTTTRIINIGASAGTVIIPGNLTVQGTNTILNTTTLTTEDDIIQLRSAGTTAMTTYAGLVATKYDGTNDGALVFDNTGTAYVGDVTIQEDGMIVDVSMQKIATREDSPTSAGVAYWDAGTSKLITSSNFTYTTSGTIFKVDNLSLDGNTLASTNVDGNIVLDPNGTGTINLDAVVNANSTLNVTGLSNLDGGIAVDSSKFTVAGDGSGNTSVGGTLGVIGITTLTALLNANGGIAVDTNKFTVADGTGNTAIAGTLTVTGTTKLDDTVDINSTVDISNNLTLSAGADLIINSTTPITVFSVDGATGNTDTKGTLDADGLASLDGGINVNDVFTVSTDGKVIGATFNKVTITQPGTGSTLTIADGKTLTSNVNFTVGATSTYTGAITIKSSDTNAKSLTLGDNLTINSLTANHVLIASADDIISSEAQLDETRGGTGIGSYTLGDTLYASGTNTLATLAGNTTALKKFLIQTGNGSTSAAPIWGEIVNEDLPESTSVAADIDAYNAVNEPDIDSMTYTAVEVNRKGVVTAGAYVLEVGSPGQATPSAELIYGGLFFKDVSPV